jgi:hypothetical protein
MIIPLLSLNLALCRPLPTTSMRCTTKQKALDFAETRITVEPKILTVAEHVRSHRVICLMPQRRTVYVILQSRLLSVYLNECHLL